MTTSRLPSTGQETVQEAQPRPKPQKEETVKANTAEAARLYKRGVAAARGGQRRIAVGLLTRSVQLDPDNEGAWLWLSGVLEDPHQIAFCLHAVLKLNPANERARKGLRWLEERQLLKGTPKPASLLDINVDESLKQRKAREQSESWWVQWRQSLKEKRTMNIIVWSVPLVLLVASLMIYQSFLGSMEQSYALPVIPTISAPTMPVQTAPAIEVAPAIAAEQPTIEALPTAIPVLENDPASVRESESIAYMTMLGPLRQQLRDEVEQYRSTTGKPGSTTIGHSAAAQRLRTSVENAYNTLRDVTPPRELQQAHANYLEGLRLELEGIDSMTEFYSSYKTEFANRAALRFQKANTHFARARITFDRELRNIQISSAVSVHTVR